MILSVIGEGEREMGGRVRWRVIKRMREMVWREGRRES